MKFRDLQVGQRFDWVDDANRTHNSFYPQCIKVGTRRYKADAPPTDYVYHVGSINAQVFHVQPF